MRFSFLFLFIFFIAISNQAQNPEWINYTYNEDIHSIVGKDDVLWLATSGGLVKFNTITEQKECFNVSNSGLTSNYVSPIALDSLGNVWMWKNNERALRFYNVSTDYLVRFDGVEWKYFRPEINSNTTWDLYPRVMEIDKNNTVWIGTNDNGLLRFDGITWSVFDTTNSNIPTNDILDIAIDYENNLWMGSGEVQGLIMFDNYEWVVYDSSNSGCPSEIIPNVEIDNTGKVWLATLNKIITFDGISWENFPSEIPNGSYIWYKAFKIDSKNDPWFLDNHLYHHSKNGWKIYALEPNQQQYYNPSVLFLDKFNNKWMSSKRQTSEGYEDYFKGGLAKFDSTGWSTYTLSNSKFKGNMVGPIFKDRKNNIWLSSDLIMEIDGHNWSYQSPKFEMRPIRSITSINEDLVGNIWFGSYGEGLLKFDGSDWEHFNEYNSNIPNNNIWDIAFDKDGNLWFTCSYEIGVVKFDGSNFTVYDSTNSGLPENYVVDIENDSKGNLYFGTGSKGMVKYDLDSWTIYDTQIKWNSIYSLYVDFKDTVWIGGFGITKYKDGIWTYYQHDDSLDYYYNVITKIDKDAENNLWAIARYGLYKFDDNSWRKFDHTNSGLPDELLSDIEFDQYGNLWIGTSSGVILFNEYGVVTDAKEIGNIVMYSNYKLFQNYPNPFNPSTTIKYQIPLDVKQETKNVKLIVYDVLGRVVSTLINENQKPGSYEVVWDAINQPSGVYFYQLTAGDPSTSSGMVFVETRKMILLR